MFQLLQTRHDEKKYVLLDKPLNLPGLFQDVQGLKACIVAVLVLNSPLKLKMQQYNHNMGIISNRLFIIE